MADHHISYEPKTSEDIENWLISHGIHIAGAPNVIHKPGNIINDDVRYPCPPYPDNRFTSTDNDIKNPGSNNSNNNGNYNNNSDIYDDLFGSFEIPDLEIDMVSHDTSGSIHIINHNPETTTMFKDVVYPYTGLAIAAKEIKAYNIAFVKDKRVHVREVITGKMYSIATFDGTKFHIYRGMCTDIKEYNSSNFNYRKSNISENGNNITSLFEDSPIKPISSQFEVDKTTSTYDYNDAVKVISNPRQITKRNMVIVLDVSEFLNSKVEVIPVNQIIDIEYYNYNYDFTIYEMDLKIYLKDWFETKENDDESTTSMNVPHGDRGVQTIHYPVVEHQKRRY